MKKYVALFLVLVILGAGAFISVRYYSYVFAKVVHGEIIKVERVNQNQSIISSGSSAVPAAQLFSFAIAIRDRNGGIHTASSEDRQWAVAQVGECAEAKFFPYPPWNFEKGGTYHGARLVRLYDCPKSK